MKVISWARTHGDVCAVDPTHQLPVIVYVDAGQVESRGRYGARVVCTRDEAEQVEQ